MVNPIVWDEDLGERDQQLLLRPRYFWVLQSQGSCHSVGIVGRGVTEG